MSAVSDKSVGSLMDESSTEVVATNKITVVCADNTRIKVDLNLFPSEFLRRLAASDFADKKEVEIPYSADHFYKIYKKYLPAIEEYLQIASPQLIYSHDLLFIRSTQYDDYFYIYHPTISGKKYQMYFYAGFWPIWPHLFGQSIKKTK